MVQESNGAHSVHRAASSVVEVELRITKDTAMRQPAVTSVILPITPLVKNIT